MRRDGLPVGRQRPYLAAPPRVSGGPTHHVQPHFEERNVLFATGAKLYLSDDNLKSCRPITVKALDGSDYLPHTPANAENPGWYFHTLPGVFRGRERRRDAGVGELLQRAGRCLAGQHLLLDRPRPHRENRVRFRPESHFRTTVLPRWHHGRAPGQPREQVLCRHVHTVAYNPVENAFYACTGDLDRGSGHECHWLRGTYEPAKEQWRWNVLVSTDSNSRYKSGGINFVDGQLYWISDANGQIREVNGQPGMTAASSGAPGGPRQSREAHAAVQPAGRIRRHDHSGRCGAGLPLRPASPLATGFIVSTDMGKTWAQYDLKECGRRSPPASTRRTTRGGSGWTCDRDGFSRPRCCSSSQSHRREQPGEGRGEGPGAPVGRPRVAARCPSAVPFVPPIPTGTHPAVHVLVAARKWRKPPVSKSGRGGANVRVFRECSRFDLVLHAVAGALDDDRLGMVEEPVQHRGGDGAVVVEMEAHCLKGLLVVSTMEPRS